MNVFELYIKISKQVVDKTGNRTSYIEIFIFIFFTDSQKVSVCKTLVEHVHR